MRADFILLNLEARLIFANLNNAVPAHLNVFSFIQIWKKFL